MIPWLSVAVAHPIGSTVAAQTTVLTVRADRIEVLYTAEVPDDLLRPRPAAPDPAVAMATELGTGLVLQVDDAVVPLEREPSPPPEPGDRHTTTFTSRYSAPLSMGARRIRVSTTNLLDARNVYAADVRLEPVFTVESCSLHAERDGRVVRDDALRWKPEEEARSVEVILASRTPRAVAWLLGRGTEPVRASALRSRTGLARLAPPAMDTLGLLAVAGAAGAAGLGSGTPRGGWRAWWPAALGPLAALLPTAGWQEVTGSALALGLAALGRHGWAVAAAVATLAATTHAGWAALLVVALAGSGASLGWGTPTSARLLAAGIAIVLLGRGILAFT